jgi:hypothetical protein
MRHFGRLRTLALRWPDFDFLSARVLDFLVAYRFVIVLVPYAQARDRSSSPQILSEFTCLELDNTITLDFVFFCKQPDWLADEPMICNADDGMVILKSRLISYNSSIIR